MMSRGVWVVAVLAVCVAAAAAADVDNAPKPVQIAQKDFMSGDVDQTKWKDYCRECAREAQSDAQKEVNKWCKLCRGSTLFAKDPPTRRAKRKSDLGELLSPKDECFSCLDIVNVVLAVNDETPEAELDIERMGKNVDDVCDHVGPAVAAGEATCKEHRSSLLAHLVALKGTPIKASKVCQDLTMCTAVDAMKVTDVEDLLKDFHFRFRKVKAVPVRTPKPTPKPVQTVDPVVPEREQYTPPANYKRPEPITFVTPTPTPTPVPDVEPEEQEDEEGIILRIKTSKKAGKSIFDPTKMARTLEDDKKDDKDY